MMQSALWTTWTMLKLLANSWHVTIYVCMYVHIFTYVSVCRRKKSFITIFKTVSCLAKFGEVSDSFIGKIS